MLSRIVRTQLIVFTVASVIAMTVMVFGYLQVPTWLGIGHITVTVQLEGTGGLYRFGNVTYRGVQIGKVSSVEPTASGATATLSLTDSPRIPADVEAHVRSVSAVGEQYVDLVPRAGGPPFLENGAVIERRDTTIPLKVGPVLDELSAMVKSVPKQKLSDLLDESFLAFDGAGYDVGSLLDSGARIAADANATADRTRILVDDSEPLLDSQAQSTEALRIWARSLSAVTGQLVDSDPEIRTVLNTGPGAADEIARLLEQVKPTLPVLLANLTTVGEVGVTYNPSLEQLLVLLPPYVAGFGSLSQLNNPVGLSLGGFSLMNGDPPPCTVGFLPPSQWRSPDDETVIDTPDGLYCKLPQDSPIAVRGVRNNPCMGKPGKRAPTVEICNSDEPYKPLAMRQHVLGPYPFDPNLVSQGVLPDDRVLPDSNTFAPIEGTPPPPPPNAAAVPYDPRTGRYIGSDGQVYEQTDLNRQPATWQDLFPR
ncbi:MCE family protein [Mycolicibacterium pulveris]|uniref:Virulence factor Mce n=1 Tax=Mycolicibacterium pulveris TaxID=36813 RepID=A0A7I7UGR7_MYCPV|nr:MlaD family protein [Mycolicibacterium pulveris]MCV6980938.1 MCE family protein [Mycolicibacterium pulveris]BBY80475.1 virulence factor Mce [Mycolicibacterium pulveris]